MLEGLKSKEAIFSSTRYLQRHTRLLFFLGIVLMVVFIILELRGLAFSGILHWHAAFQKQIVIYSVMGYTWDGGGG